MEKRPLSADQKRAMEAHAAYEVFRFLYADDSRTRLCGGAATALFCGDHEPGDWDIFRDANSEAFYNPDQRFLLPRLVSKFGKDWDVVEDGCNIRMKKRESGESVDVVWTKYPYTDVFDISPCRVGTDGQFFYARKEDFCDIEQRRGTYYEPKYTVAAERLRGRLEKYHARGFDLRPDELPTPKARIRFGMLYRDRRQGRVDGKRKPTRKVAAAEHG